MIRTRYEVGKKYADLTLLSVLDERSAHRIAGRFQCSCGKVRELAIGRVKSGRIQHCGCKTVYGTPKHGMRNSPEYSSWGSMKDRCLNPQSKDYPRYGGAGVTVHAAWALSFEEFYDDIGPRPQGTTLDRINPQGNYEPGNVRWASPTTQASNQLDSWTVEIDGKTFESVQSAARAFGVSPTTIARWCDGSTDPRRPRLPSIPPRSGCSRWRRYS